MRRMKILLENLDLIREQFESVIKYSQDLDINIDATNLFEDFVKAKLFFIEKFGGFIYQYPVKVSLPVLPADGPAAVLESVVDKINAYLSSHENLSPQDKLDIVYIEIWLLSNINGFITNKISYVADEKILQNTLDKFFHEAIEDPEKKDYFCQQWTDKVNSVPIGTKLLKSFKYFISNKKVMRDIQDLCSQNIQENHTIEGTLCLSVHPLDFLSLSENAHNWRSCHALDGDYRAGNVSYMMDSCTFIAYIKADGEYQLTNFPEEVKWNSKKLRRLFFLSNDKNMLFAGRSYPFECDALLDFVKDNIFNKYFSKKDPTCGGFFHREYYWSDWSNETLDTYIDAAGEKTPLCESYYHLGGYLKSIKDFVKDSKSGLHYDDLLYSSCYTPKYSILMYRYKGETDTTVETIEGYITKQYPSVSYTTKFNIGGDCNCLHCGKKIIFDSGTFLCKECELEYGHSCQDLISVCPVCGRRFEEADGVWNSRLDELICPDCYQDYGEDEDYGD